MYCLFFHIRWYFLGSSRYEMWFSIVSWASWVLCYMIYCIKPQMKPHVWENIGIISFCSVTVEVEVSHLALFNTVKERGPLLLPDRVENSGFPFGPLLTLSHLVEWGPPLYYFLCISTNSVAGQGHWPHCCWVRMKVPAHFAPWYQPGQDGAHC